MSSHRFPHWAPEPVIAEWKKELKDIEYWSERFPSVEPECDDADLLFRMLTYPEMKQVWEKLPKYEIKPTLFSSMVLLSTKYIDIKPYNLTPKDYEKWLSEVKSTALKLRELIQLTDYDKVLQESYYKKRKKLELQSIFSHTAEVFRSDFDEEAHKKTKPDYKSWPDFLPSLMSDALYKIATLDSDDDVGMLGVKRKSVKLDKPSHPNAKRSYFIRKLTQLLRDKTGQPLREITTITAATAFDNPSLTQRQVVRIAP